MKIQYNRNNFVYTKALTVITLQLLVVHIFNSVPTRVIPL